MYSLTGMAKRNSNTTLNYPTTSRAIQLVLNPIAVEIDNQRNLCRVERKNGNYGGYMKEILTENLTERDHALLICELCEGITREACISSSGGQFCSCYEVRESKSSTTNKLVSTIVHKTYAIVPNKPQISVTCILSSSRVRLRSTAYVSRYHLPDHILATSVAVYAHDTQPYRTLVHTTLSF